MEKKRKVLLAVIAMTILIAVVGVAYAFFRVILDGDRETSVEIGGITFTYNEEDEALLLSDASRMSDTDGMDQEEYFEFSITLNKNVATSVSYNIYFTEKTSNGLTANNIRYYLTDGSDNQIVVPGTVGLLDLYDLDQVDNNSYLLYRTTITPDTTTKTATTL